MSNIFQEVLSDANAVQTDLLGPTYPYYKNIKTPSQIGMSDQGSLSALGSDINGLIQYVEVLVTGNSEASATGGPLGDKFFLQTGAQCTDVSTGNLVDRYIYVDNVPDGDIPFISQGLGVNFSNFEGLIPGAMGNLNVLNPFAIMSSFLAGSNPPCQELTMQTIDVNNNVSSQTEFVTQADIGAMDPCTFQNGVNPVNGNQCVELFQNMDPNKTKQNKKGSKKNTNIIPDDPIVQVYFTSLAIVGIYIFYCLMNKSK
jgi:hypothetical protein